MCLTAGTVLSARTNAIAPTTQEVHAAPVRVV
jgi:hypothetical protein